MRRRLRRRALPLLAAPLLGPAGGAFAQAGGWAPSRPVRLVVPFSAGGPTDLIARLVAGPAEAAWRQPVVVENRPGAGGSTGGALVARAAPDGHTLLVTANSHAINPAVLRNLPFDTLRDFAAVVRLADGPFVLVVPPSVPVRALPEFVAHAKARAGRLNYASPGHGTGNHLAMERLKAAAGIEIAHIPYGGAAPATQALLAGQVDAMFNNMVNTVPHAAESRMVPLAIGSRERSRALPGVPSLTETYPDLTAMNWYGAFAPAGTPAPALAALNATLAAAMAEPAVRDRLLAQGIEPVAGPAEAFGREVAEEVALWAEVVRAAGIRVE